MFKAIRRTLTATAFLALIASNIAILGHAGFNVVASAFIDRVCSVFCPVVGDVLGRKIDVKTVHTRRQGKTQLIKTKRETRGVVS